jgi:tetratricopeptide (TPR) repeat protein
LHKNPDTSGEGLERLRAAVRANPRSTTFVALAHRLCDAGRPAEAEDVCREGLARHPGLVTGQVALGRALLDRGRLREAQETLIAAAKANPDHGDAFRWLGEVVIKRDDLPRARILLEYAEDLSPNDRRVSELLIEAGGTPSLRSPRPKTDFEHTRVGNARALAERMHEDPEEPTRVGPPITAILASEAQRPAAGAELVDDPTVVDSRAVLQALRNDAAPPTPLARVPFSAESDKIPIPVVGGELNAPDDPSLPNTSRLPLIQVADDDRTPVNLRPPPSTGRHRTMSALRPVEAGAGRRLLALIGGGVLLGGAALAVFYAVRTTAGGAEKLRAKMTAEMTTGSWRSLSLAHNLGRQIATAAPGDGEALAQLAFVQALLHRDYGVGERAAVEETLKRAQQARGTSAARTGLVQATCAMLALTAGRLADAQQCAERAVAATPDGAPALLAAARVKIHQGDPEGARRDLEHLLRGTPSDSAAVLERAALSMDLGDPAAAAQWLREQVKRTSDHLRARLLLAEAERALGERSAGQGLEAGCRAESRQSPTLRVGCLLAASAQSRLAGEHQQAIRSARAAAADAPAEPRLLASAALALAGLGEIDAADEVLRRAKGLARETAPPIVWADAAVRLGRRQVVMPGRLLETAVGPERRLVAARLMLAYEGPQALAKMLSSLPRGLVLVDPDLGALAKIAEDAAGGGDRADLEARADRGDPMASYVLGRLLERRDPRQAARRLEKGAWGHGDTCDAITIYRNVMRQLGSPPALRTLREVRTRNSQCPAAQI